MERDVIVQVQNRKTLLFDENVMDYREHEHFDCIRSKISISCLEDAARKLGSLCNENAAFNENRL